jgi:hypothetical protein
VDLALSAVRFTDYQSFQLSIPAVNCWATIIRPLCGLKYLLFVQGQTGPHNPVFVYLRNTLTAEFEKTRLIGFAQKVPSVVSGAEIHTKSELGAKATSRTLNLPGWSAVWAAFSCVDSSAGRYRSQF